MKKIVVAVLVATCAVAGAAMAGMGTVEKVEGDKVTVACKKTVLKAGEKVELKAEGKKKDAAASSCTVDKAEGGKVELTCEKAAVKVGEKVEVKAEVKKTEVKAEEKKS